MARLSTLGLEYLGAGLARIVRFSAVGLLASGVYAVGMLLLVGQLGQNAVLSNVIAFAAAIPVSFVGQKHYAFRSKGDWVSQFARFSLTQGVNLGLSAALIYVVTDVLHVPYQVGIVAVIALIATLSYLSFDRFVFSHRSRSADAEKLANSMPAEDVSKVSD